MWDDDDPPRCLCSACRYLNCGTLAGNRSFVRSVHLSLLVCKPPTHTHTLAHGHSRDDHLIIRWMALRFPATTAWNCPSWTCSRLTGTDIPSGRLCNENGCAPLGRPVSFKSCSRQLVQRSNFSRESLGFRVIPAAGLAPTSDGIREKGCVPPV